MREVGSAAFAPVDQSPFDPAVHALHAAHEPAIVQAARTFHAAGTPAACFHTHEGTGDEWEPDNASSVLCLVGPRS